MHSFRLLSSAMLLLLASAATSAHASPNGVVISGFQVRGPAGGNDEYVEIRNTSAINADISGWKLQGCASGTPGTASTRATVGTNIVLTPGQYYLFTNNASGGYSGARTCHVVKASMHRLRPPVPGPPSTCACGSGG